MLKGVRKRVGGDERLARRAAFAALHSDHATGVYNLALRILGDREDAQDVSQEVLLKAYVQLEREGDLNLRPWLYRVTVNACYDHLRSLRRRPVTEVDPEWEPTATVDGYEQSELQRHVGVALRGLPPAQRAALVLREVHGLRTHEVADVLGVQPDSAAVTLSRARVTFRARFTESSCGVALGVAPLSVLGSLPEMPLPSALHLASLLAAAASAAAGAGAATGGALAGLMGKLTTAVSTKAAVVALSATVVAGSVGGVYTYERIEKPRRPHTATRSVDSIRVQASPFAGPAMAGPAPRATNSASPSALPSPSGSPLALTSPSPATASPSPSPSPTTTDDGGSGDDGGTGTLGMPTITPSPSPTPSATSTTPPTPTPAPVTPAPSSSPASSL